MTVLFFLIPWVLVGLGVIFIAFWGGPGGARQAYLTRASGTFKASIVIIYLLIGIAVPAIILAARPAAVGATARLSDKNSTPELQNGKKLFRATCASCHTLAAVNARGPTGPDLDTIGLNAMKHSAAVSRIENAIRIGGTGQGRMPSGLLTGPDAAAVANYVATVAGR